VAQYSVDLVAKVFGGEAVSRLSGAVKDVERAVATAKTEMDRLTEAVKRQKSANAEVAGNLLRVKQAYAELTAEAKASAKAGGEGFSKDVVNRLRGLQTEIDRYKQKLLEGKNAQHRFNAELDKAQAELKETEAAAKRAGAGMAPFKDAVGGVAGKFALLAAQLGLTIGAVALFKSSLDAAFSREAAENRLQSLAGSAKEYEQALVAAEVASKRFGTTQTEDRQCARRHLWSPERPRAEPGAGQSDLHRLSTSSPVKRGLARKMRRAHSCS